MRNYQKSVPNRERFFDCLERHKNRKEGGHEKIHLVINAPLPDSLSFSVCIIETFLGINFQGDGKIPQTIIIGYISKL